MAWQPVEQAVRWAVLFKMLIVILVIAALASGLGVVFFGYVEGTEFSPEALMRRDFAYYVEPLTGTQLSPVFRNSYLGEVEQQLVAKGWVKPRAAGAWHLVRGRYGARAAGPQPAALLCESLDTAGTSGKPFWLGWNEQHPAEASRLWPAVFVLARHGWYELIPELLEAARGASSPGVTDFRLALQQAVDEQVQRLLPRCSESDRQSLQEALRELAVIWEEPAGERQKSGN